MIAVLPFVPFDEDGAVEMLGDGLAEEIIHVFELLPRVKGGRDSCFRFRGPAHDLRKITADLGTDFIVQGSIQRMPLRFRVTAQLIEAKRLTVRWSEQFEREVGISLKFKNRLRKRLLQNKTPPWPIKP